MEGGKCRDVASPRFIVNQRVTYLRSKGTSVQYWEEKIRVGINIDLS